MVKLKEREFYSVVHRRKVTVKKDDIGVTKIKNKKIKGGIPALKGYYDGVIVTKFIKQSKYNSMLKKYGKW